MKDRRLQVLIENAWKYVFCHNQQTGLVTTNKRHKAVKGHGMQYFQMKYANRMFRVN